jgi:hypothetical protein
VVAIAAKQKRSRNPDREVKYQVCGDVPAGRAAILEHLDLRLRQAPAPAFGNDVSAEHIKRIVILPHWARCAIAGMALPRLGWPRDPESIGGVHVCF